MKRYDFLTLVENGQLSALKVALSIGVFDGLHSGHMEILETCVAEARKLGISSMCITFNRNPKMSTGSQRFQKSLMSERQRDEMLASLGFDVLVVIDFSSNFSKLSAVEFLNLVGTLCLPKVMVVGEDFHCGALASSAGVDGLREYLSHHGSECTLLVPPLKRLPDGEVISSTLVRKCLSEGDLNMVRTLLGRPYGVDLTRYSCSIQPESLVYRRGSFTQMLPPDGLYAGLGICADGKELPLSVRLTDDALSLSSESLKESGICIRQLNFVTRSGI